jgi:glycosyltransferase involved in cell wall biosynthesis/SAM-dependent methyltransferase
VVCVNADQTPTFRRDVGQEFFRDRYSIGVWFWEIAEFPDSLHAAFGAIDEVWAASDFVRDAIAGATSKPVFTMPLPVRFPDPPDLSREELALPEDYLFLFSFDFLSVFERKNPLGLLDAFTRAFQPGEGPVLVLKSINGDKKLHELERLRAAAEERPDVLVRDGYLSVEKKNALAAACDCYVSLHRSEGFGLTMAEAMAYGKPVIATGYSGNLAFMTEANSYLVPYRLGRIPPGCDPYPADVEWAEPDIDEAARLMRRVWEDREEASERGRAARVSIEQERSPERMGQWADERLAEIRREYGTVPRRKPLIAEIGGRVAGVRRTARRAVPAPSGRPELEAARADGSPLERARTFMSRGPTNAWRAPSPRLGSMGVLSRRVLHRILQPYIVRQRELETAVVDALIKADEDSQAQREMFTALRTQVQALGAQFDARGAELDAVVAELTAVPYAAEPALLRTRGRDGGEQIGYRGSDGAAGGAGVYRGFEEIFRGPEDFIRERQRPYLNVLARHAPVLDVGCGRGELLDLLAEAGVPARGIDIDPEMVARSREKGHDVELAEARAYLSTLSDGSLGAVFSAQVIEHLDYEALVSFFALAREKVAPGGLFVAETVNPHSIQAFKAFWVDPTHRGPIFPEVAVALCRLHGYGEARVVFPNGTGDLERDRRAEGEYAVVATR